MTEVTRNHLKFTNEGGRNHLILNGKDIAGEVEIDGFSITLDRETMHPVLSVRYALDEIEVDVQDVAVEEQS